jgi:hypothetical protein
VRALGGSHERRARAKVGGNAGKLSWLLFLVAIGGKIQLLANWPDSGAVAGAGVLQEEKGLDLVCKLFVIFIEQKVTKGAKGILEPRIHTDGR